MYPRSLRLDLTVSDRHVSSIFVFDRCVDILEVRRLVLEKLALGFPRRKIVHGLQHGIVDERLALDVASIDLRVCVLGKLGSDVDFYLGKELLECGEEGLSSCLGSFGHQLSNWKGYGSFRLTASTKVDVENTMLALSRVVYLV